MVSWFNPIEPTLWQPVWHLTKRIWDLSEAKGSHFNGFRKIRLLRRLMQPRFYLFSGTVFTKTSDYNKTHFEDNEEKKRQNSTPFCSTSPHARRGNPSKFQTINSFSLSEPYHISSNFQDVENSTPFNSIEKSFHFPFKNTHTRTQTRKPVRIPKMNQIARERSPFHETSDLVEFRTKQYQNRSRWTEIREIWEESLPLVGRSSSPKQAIKRRSKLK